MDMHAIKDLLKQYTVSNVTKAIHRTPYPAILPTRPELSQAGRTVLVTGGGTGVGFGVARNFVQASADTVIIVGRRAAVLDTAASSLEQIAKAAGTSTKIITKTCDITNIAQIEALWKDLSAQKITVDVFVSNAVKFTEPKPLLELGADEVWSQMEANVKAPIYFAQQFCTQPGGGQKFIINITSAVIHTNADPVIQQRPAYSLTKGAGTLYFYLLANEVPADKVQIVSFHPGLIYNEMWGEGGFDEHDDLFDSADIPGGVAVWGASKEAAFLHGRFFWATWDVNELSTGELRKRCETDPYFLTPSVIGLKGRSLA
ncbi:hypothetical protein A1O1_01862 [Capronia coronata CBS 617.96]|uniref:Uncharacterized protein n=1 Tax=Capronia coronata CBS 617.96 TaxID=1182541 RepID=W9YUX5_9EURO|nr:uncharacterized protein A1O1_01862 [Capronia coronata CBS 617.96]EXJ93470.1 hypothetical protein A1O1_01862 [Capronia coronata CBS 617.96]